MLPPWMNLYAILTMATTLISVVGIQDGMTLTRGRPRRRGAHRPVHPDVPDAAVLVLPLLLPDCALDRGARARFAVKG